MLTPLSSALDGITFLGFVGFFVWIAATGATRLRQGEQADELTPAPTVWRFPAALAVEDRAWRDRVRSRNVPRD